MSSSQVDTLESEQLSVHPLFSGFSTLEIKAFLKRSRKIHKAPGDLLYLSGEKAEYAWLIQSGAFQIEYPKKNSKRGHVVAILKSPAIVGECQLLTKEPWTGTGAVITHIEALQFDRQGWIGLLKSNARIAERLYFELATRFLNTIQARREQLSGPPPMMIARYCAAVLSVLGPEEALNIEQKNLARAVDLSREKVNRTLRAWENSDLVETKRGMLVIKNRKKLEALAGDHWQDLVQSFQMPNF